MLKTKKKLSKKVLIITSATLVCIILVIAISYHEYQKALYGTKLTGLGIDNKTYDVVDGQVKSAGKSEGFLPQDYRVLFLANYVLTEKEDPLFTTPGINQDQFSAGVNTLESQQNAFLKSLGLKQEIAPVNFLKAVVEVNKNYETLSKSPTLENANNLVGSEEKAKKEYAKSVKELKDKVQGDFSKKGATFNNIDSSTDTQTILSDLALMEQNASKLETEVASRRNMLKGLSLYKPVFQIENINTKLPDRKTLSVQELNLNAENIKSYSGPYLVNTSCFGGMNQGRYMFVVQKNTKGIDITVPKLADENYFSRLSAKYPSEKKLIDQGYGYQLINEGNSYRCNDLEYEARLFTIDNFRKDFRNNLLFAELNNSHLINKFSPEIINKIRQYESSEQNFLLGNKIGDGDLSDLTSAYSDAYQELIKLPANDSQKTELQEKFLERYLYLARRGSALNEIFNTGLFFTDISDRVRNGTVDTSESSLNSLYPIRSSYSISYFNFTSSVWRMSEKPKYLYQDSKPKSPAAPYVTFSTLLNKYSKAQILSWYKVTESDIVGIRNN